MVTMNSRLLAQFLGVLVVLSYVYIFWTVNVNKDTIFETDFDDVRQRIQRLEGLLKNSDKDIAKLRRELSLQNDIYERLEKQAKESRESRHEQKLSEARATERRPVNLRGGSLNPWPEPIPVLVLSCHRARAVSEHITKLLKYRSSAREFPIVVSQDCDNAPTAEVIKAFGSRVQYIKHLSGENANVTAAPNHERYLTYYKIARHYKLALSHVLDVLGHSSVIITEDDLDIAPDFFEYFRATRYLMERDDSLYCVSAWNDNAKPTLVDFNSPYLLYRSDFFPGLGWMMTSDVWNELKPKWPLGFWDDWIRDPAQRLNRSCIRPEVPRTGMTPEGRKGASNGLFYVKHLAQITMNTKPVNFSQINLDYLLKENYDAPFVERVYSAPLVTLDALFVNLNLEANAGKQYRIEYSTLQQYLDIASRLKIMPDFKAGVPRTAYRGVVTCFVRKVRIFVAPDRANWSAYNTSWEAPNSMIGSM